MEQEMRIAAEIQQALLPKAGRGRRVLPRRGGLAAVPLDRRRLLRLRRSARRGLRVRAGDVAGKGPPAALLSAMMQGIFAAQAAASDPPSQTIARVNLALYRRGIESRFVTLMYGVLEPDGRLTYCNAGHNPPLVSGKGGVRRLEVGGPIVGLFEGATFRGRDRQLVAGRLADRVQRRRVGGAVGRRRGVRRGADPGRPRRSTSALEPADMLQAIFTDVRDVHRRGAPQSDDITALVLGYGG